MKDVRMFTMAAVLSAGAWGCMGQEDMAEIADVGDQAQSEEAGPPLVPYEGPLQAPSDELDHEGGASFEEATNDSEDVGVNCINAVDIGFTVWNPPTDLHVRGSGSWTRCDNSFTRIQITLYKQVIGDIYTSADIASFDPADFGSHSAGVSQLCDGSRNWYTTIRAFDSAGEEIMSKQSNSILANCP